jgi:hypothetical protein
MARRSGRSPAVDFDFEGRGFAFFRRRFFDTGICLVPIGLSARPIDNLDEADVLPDAL